jgi:hypothetical protein
VSRPSVSVRARCAHLLSPICKEDSKIFELSACQFVPNRYPLTEIAFWILLLLPEVVFLTPLPFRVRLDAPMERRYPIHRCTCTPASRCSVNLVAFVERAKDLDYIHKAVPRHPHQRTWFSGGPRICSNPTAKLVSELRASDHR